MSGLEVKINNVWLWVFISILLISYRAFPQSQEIRFEHFTVEDGLPTNSTWNMTQDYLGFMWFITSNGLVKYDGYEFTVYQADENDPNSIYVSDGANIYEDKDHNLWITLVNGMSLYNRKDDNFTNYLNDPNADGKNTNIFYDIDEDYSGTLWVGTISKGLLKLVRHAENFDSNENIIEKSYTHDPDDSTSITSDCVYTIYEDKSGILWLATNKGLCKYNRKTDDFTTYKINKRETYYNRMYSILEDSRDNFWIGTLGGGLAKFDRRECKFEIISFTGKINSYSELPIESQAPNRLQRSIVEDYNGTLWIPTNGAGIINFNPSTGSFSFYSHNPADPNSLSPGGEYAHSIYRDRSNVYWVSSRQGGLNKFSKDKKLIHIVYNPSNPKGLSSRTVSCIYEDNSGMLWMGTGGAVLNKYDRKTNNFIHYQMIPLNDSLVSNDYIRCIFEDSEGLLWIGMHIGGLYKFNKSTGKFFRYVYDPNNRKGISDMVVTSIIEDEAGRLWIGNGWEDLNELNKETGEFYHHKKYSSSSSDDDSVSLKKMYDMFMDDEGIIWSVGKFGNLNKYDPATGQGKRFKFDRLSGDYVLFSIYEDTKNRIWIGRDSGGLLRFNKQTESYKIYKLKDGLPDETVGAILEDDQGNLWMRTGTSICRFNPVTETFKVFKLINGFQKFNCWRAWKSKLTGEMYFPGDDGLYIFHPDSIKDNLIPPKIVLTDFRIFDKSVRIGKESPLKKHISIAKEVILQHWQNDFSIKFAAIHYTNPSGNQHKYKLSGYDEDWRTADENRLAKYTNMSPGDYVFKVIGSNSDGIWNKEGVSLMITILHPWWATGYAYSAYILMIIGMVYFIWRMQLNRVRIKHEYEMSKFEAEKMHEVDEMKNRFFANLSHEFRTPLTLIFGPAKDIIDETKEIRTKENAGIIKRNASRLYNLVNQLLDLSKLEAGKMKLEISEQNIIPLLKGYVLSFSSLAERKKITLRFDTSEIDLKVFVDKEKVEKIVNNLLSNAFKFTPEGGRIDFSVEKLSEYVKMTITDNGIGIAKEKMDKIFNRFYQVDGSHTREGEGTGIGLSLTKELVELHKGKIEVESEYGKGTSFKVYLPFGKEHLKQEDIVVKEFSEETEGTPEKSEIHFESEKGNANTDVGLLMETEKPLILIVEDNPDVRKYIIGHLEKDYGIQESVDGEDGLKKATEQMPDLIISDIMMPKMDGFGLCEKIKTDERTSHIPIILLTAKATDKDKTEGYETGADDYIMKPFDADVLKARISNLIEQRRKLREHFRKEGLIEIENKDITSIEKRFLQNVVRIINDHISDTAFGVETLADEVSMSRRNLDRKLLAVTGEAPGDLIRRIRLTYAAELIKRNFGNISEIALEAGFSSPAYFSKCFREQFGLAPSEYIHNHSK